ncbi:hypothetical protein F4678DRAFT_478125 [Xylaria arbuscula]|nr:hypothetical protein F4678DRAFT_478125 [Xylaria arbuscula]
MAPDPKSQLSCTLGGQLYVCTRGEVHVLGCYPHNLCADGNQLSQIELSKTTIHNTVNCVMVAQHQCYGAEVGNSGIVECYWCDSVRLSLLGCHSSNTVTTPQICPGNIGITALSDHPLNAEISKEHVLSLDSKSTVDNGDEPTGITTNGSVNRRHAAHHHTAKKKFNSTLCIEIIVPILGCAILLLAAYFLFRSRKRKQEKSKKKEESEESAMEMGNLGRREERDSDIIGAPTMPTENLMSRQNSSDTASFTRPRRAPFPPPASPPPDRPLPPLPVRGRRHASMVSRGRGNRNRMGNLPQWPLADGMNISPSAGDGPDAFGLSHMGQQ